ncbi:MAG: hypothetical protein IT326_08350 [Anaerolineae bacterium]|nr:hypothetical protein [Anaerolineae bacterium]
MALLKQSFYVAPPQQYSTYRSGERWGDLINTLRVLPRTDPQVMALTLTLRRVLHETGGAQFADAFCPACNADALERMAGDDNRLLTLYYACLEDVKASLCSMRMRRRMPATPRMLAYS